MIEFEKVDSRIQLKTDKNEQIDGMVYELYACPDGRETEVGRLSEEEVEIAENS